MVIYHIAEKTHWEKALATGEYRAPSLEKAGFIHCSLKTQLIRVANTIFRGRRDLVLLCIEEDRLGVPVRYENLEGGSELFPHIYGPLPLEAVREVLPFEPDENGLFKFPEET